MPLVRWFRRLRARPAAPAEAPIDPLPWTDHISQVRAMMDALDAARPAAPDRSDTLADNQAAPDTGPRDGTQA